MTTTHRILVVEDDADVRAYIVTFLRARMLEAHVEGAPEAQSALDILEREPFDLVLSDQRMPGMDGVTFLGKVSERWPHMARIMITGYPELETVLRAVNEGRVHAFLDKPVHGDVLLAAIQGALERRGAPDAPPEGEVVLVEDDREVCRLVESYFGLVMPEVRLVSFPNGRDAIQFMSTHHVDVILADYHLPDMTGEELIERAHAEAPAARSVIITGAPPPGFAGRAQREHLADRLFIKPMDMNAFARAVRHLLPRG